MTTEKSGWQKVAQGIQLAALGSVLTACNILPQPEADTTRHFTLTAPVTVAPVADATTVRPVQIAGHLRSREMAIRVSEHEIVYNEDARWAEPLDTAITQLLQARLGAIGGGNSVTVQVQRCELVRAEGNSVQFAATYTITPPVNLSPNASVAGEVRRGNFVASERPWDGKDPGALVGLLRAAINEFADALAAAVEKK